MVFKHKHPGCPINHVRGRIKRLSKSSSLGNLMEFILGTALFSVIIHNFHLYAKYRAVTSKLYKVEKFKMITFAP